MTQEPSTCRFRQDLLQNPYFDIVSHEMAFPFSYEAFLNNPNLHASVIHEYYHLLQAFTTTWGLYNFTGVAERFVFLFNAVTARQKLFVPLSRWPKHLVDGCLSQHFEYEKHFKSQLAAADGRWMPPIKAPEYSLVELDVPVPGQKPIRRIHVTREVTGKRYAVPLLGHVLAESQAETVAAYLSAGSTAILNQAGREEAKDRLPYTSVAAIVQTRLPKYHLHETVFFLTDCALMTFAPDYTFAALLRKLEGRRDSPPCGKTEWTQLLRLLEKEIPTFKRSREQLEETLAREYAVYEKHDKENNHPVLMMFRKRLALGKTVLEMRDRDPLRLFPWGRDPEVFERDLLAAVPVGHARFCNGMKRLGPMTKDIAGDQDILTASAHLLRILTHTDNYAPDCPFVDDRQACKAERTIACRMAPWSRGDLGDGSLCAIGLIGTSLQIENSEWVAVREDEGQI